MNTGRAILWLLLLANIAFVIFNVLGQRPIFAAINGVAAGWVAFSLVDSYKRDSR